MFQKFVYQFLLPKTVQTGTHEVVHEIVAVSHIVKNFPNQSFLFIGWDVLFTKWDEAVVIFVEAVYAHAMDHSAVR